MANVVDWNYLVQERDIKDTYAKLQEIINYFRSQNYHQHAMKLFWEDFRKLPISVADDLEAFAVPDEYEEIPATVYPDWMRDWDLGFIRGGHMVFSGRCVYPVKNAVGQPIGFIGWDPYATPKYKDSSNIGYKAKATTLFGMENIGDYYKSDKLVFLTEGTMCCAYLRLHGFQALSSLGSSLSKYQIEILRRFGRRLVVVPDDDAAGYKFIQQVICVLPEAQIVTVSHGKDIEGCRKVNDFKYENILLSDLANLSNPFYITQELVRRTNDRRYLKRTE